MKLHRVLSQIALIIGVLLLSAGVQTFAFTPPTAQPPNGDAYAPLNTGPDVQTKVGDICTDAGGGKCLSTAGGAAGGGAGGGGSETDPTVKSWAKTDNPTIPGSVTTPSITDLNDAGYYVDPNGTSRTNYTIANNIYLYGSITGAVWVGNRWVPDGTVISCQGGNGTYQHYALISNGRIYIRVVVHTFWSLHLDSGYQNVYVVDDGVYDIQTDLTRDGISGSEQGIVHCTANWP